MCSHNRIKIFPYCIYAFRPALAQLLKTLLVGFRHYGLHLRRLSFLNLIVSWMSFLNQSSIYWNWFLLQHSHSTKSIPAVTCAIFLTTTSPNFDKMWYLSFVFKCPFCFLWTRTTKVQWQILGKNRSLHTYISSYNVTLRMCFYAIVKQFPSSSIRVKDINRFQTFLS